MAKRTAPRHPRKPPHNLCLESLEDRRLLSAGNLLKPNYLLHLLKENGFTKEEIQAKIWVQNHNKEVASTPVAALGLHSKDGANDTTATSQLLDRDSFNPFAEPRRDSIWVRHEERTDSDREVIPVTEANQLPVIDTQLDLPSPNHNPVHLPPSSDTHLPPLGDRQEEVTLPPVHDGLVTPDRGRGPNFGGRSAGLGKAQVVADLIYEREVTNPGMAAEGTVAHSAATFLAADDGGIRPQPAMVATSSITLARESAADLQIVSIDRSLLPSGITAAMSDVVFGGAGTEGEAEGVVDIITGAPQEADLLAGSQMLDSSALEAAIENFLAEMHELGEQTAGLGGLEIPAYVAVVVAGVIAFEVGRRYRRKAQPKLGLATTGSASTLTWMPGSTLNNEW